MVLHIACYCDSSLGRIPLLNVHLLSTFNGKTGPHHGGGSPPPFLFSGAPLNQPSTFVDECGDFGSESDYQVTRTQSIEGCAEPRAILGEDNWGLDCEMTHGLWWGHLRQLWVSTAKRAGITGERVLRRA